MLLFCVLEFRGIHNQVRVKKKKNLLCVELYDKTDFAWIQELLVKFGPSDSMFISLKNAKSVGVVGGGTSRSFPKFNIPGIVGIQTASYIGSLFPNLTTYLIYSSILPGLKLEYVFVKTFINCYFFKGRNYTRC